MSDARIRKCPLHHLRPRCPGCESRYPAEGYFPTIEVPQGTAEWLRNSARFFDAMGPISATEFVTAISVDLREVA